MTLVNCLCRLYSVMLYAYPRQFRAEYGPDMRQLFRDRARELSAKPGRFILLRFCASTLADWAASVAREGLDAVRKPKKQRGLVTEWTLTILAYLFISATLVQAYVVPTGSMESTVKVGDHLLVERVDRTVQRGDIIAFTYPDDVRETFVKRVIGIPGDRIRLENKRVIRNGKLLVEPYVQHITAWTDPYRDDFPKGPDPEASPRGLEMLEHNVVRGELIVPGGQLFVMGDNRDNSLDSRYWGFVPQGYVIGKPILIYWSYDAPTADLESWSARHLADVAGHFFTRTRWDRTFTIPHSRKAREVALTE